MSFPEFEAKSRADLRNWLSVNHKASGTAWVITYKKHTKHYLDYGDLISELLCWGWVDSVSGRVDDDRVRLRISPRNPKSAWSRPNKTKVVAERATGQMTPAGEAAIEVAKANGMWEFLDDVEDLIVPADLGKALGDNLDKWDAYPRSVKRGSLEWVKTAKRPATRAKRIADITSSIQTGQRPTPFRA